MDEGGGIVRISNFLPDHVAEGILEIVQVEITFVVRTLI